jgi:CRP-like cAMP-binding protein
MTTPSLPRQRFAPQVRQGTPLLTLDPELGRLLEGERLEEARRELVARLHTLPAGEWDAARLAGADPGHVGLLLLEGVIAREVVVADTVSAELLGPGDVVRPWSLDEDARLLQATVRWMVLSPARLAVLDRRFAAQLTSFPEVNTILIDRLNERAQRLAVTQAISQLNRVDRRLLALFWHLAERWGRVVGGGISVPLVLPHRLLAQLVGARRPTVSTALGDLARRGELVRRPDGTWLLTGQPIGLPSADAARAIRSRRSLLPLEPAAPAPPAPVPIPERVMASATTLRPHVERVLSRAAMASEDLRVLRDQAAEVCARTQQLREARRRGNRPLLRAPV